jgi:hypothetical protein
MKILLSGWVSGHLVLGHFGFWVVSSRIGSGRVSGHLVLGHFGFQFVSCRVESSIGLSSIGSF